MQASQKEKEWKSVGIILVKSFKDYKYFSSCLCPAFTITLVFGEHSVSSDVLFQSLLLYISQQERDLQKALKEDLVGREQEELLDLVDRLGQRTLPKRDNLKATLVCCPQTNYLVA